eukprot:scaffold16418_cov36-Phaeocystis_antarctica.AAC.1
MSIRESHHPVRSYSAKTDTEPKTLRGRAAGCQVDGRLRPRVEEAVASMRARAPSPRAGGMPLTKRAASHHSSAPAAERGPAAPTVPKTLTAR